MATEPQSCLSREQELLALRNPHLVYNTLLENIDNSHSNNIVIDFLGMADMKFFLKNWEVPGLDLSAVAGLERRRDGMHDSYMWKLPGDKLEVSNIALTFFCDERWIIYEKFLDLMLRQSQRLIEYLLYGVIYIFDNNHKNCEFQYFLKDAWITNLTGVKGSFSSPAELEFDVTFAVNSVGWERNTKGV